VVPVAAVLKVGTTDGEIFVRPAIEQQYYFGQFTHNTTVTPAAANTAYALAWDTTVISEGISRTGSPTTRLTVAHSGLYNFAARIQFSSSNSNAKSGWMWLKKNGTTNISSSTAIGSLKDSGGYAVLAINDFVSLAANDYVELFYAVDDTGLKPTTVAATAFAPSAPTAHVAITQVQQ
jgi:ABC-type Fe3+ transport system substrate-binding protein